MRLRREKLPLLRDGLLASLLFALVGVALRWPLLNLPTLATGGDTASHLMYAWYFNQVFLPAGQLTAWMPEVFGGLPFLSYYFPVPFLTSALLDPLLGFGAGFKWTTALPSLLLPGMVYLLLRYALHLRWLGALAAALGTLAFLLHGQNSIWGGNLLSTLAGEFAYSYGQLWAIAALVAWLKVQEGGRAWVLAAVLEAATGASHGYALLVLGFATLVLPLFDAAPWRCVLNLIRGHALAFCLLAGWLWPLLEMGPYTVANDGVFWVQDWRDLLPQTLWPFALAGVVGVVLWLRKSVRAGLDPRAVRAGLFFSTAAMTAALGWAGAEHVGLADIRFFPFVWLCGGIAAGLFFGEVLTLLCSRCKRAPLAEAGCAAVMLLASAQWLAPELPTIANWAEWNYRGYEAKPQWQQLSTLFPALAGTPASPRLVFEHAPDNQDLGSTRALEALPMFLGGRPVLEGLYMESALLGPAVYWLQSELSERPSAPLAAFPAGHLDARGAALHMRWLYADTVLLRSEAARRELEESGLFEPLGQALPFSAYRLRGFDVALVEPVRWPLQRRPRQGWKQDAFDWFRRLPVQNAPQPYYPLAGEPGITQAVLGEGATRVTGLQLSRDRIRFRTTAPGQPHLVRMAFHPRWQLQTAGRLYLAAPGFMLVVPESEEVELNYGSTMLGRAGAAVSVVAALLAFGLMLRSQVPTRPPAALLALPLLRRGGGAMALMLAGVLALCAVSSEQEYRAAWEMMDAGKPLLASVHFQRAVQTRQGQARREEALFWAARSLELGQQPNEALELYAALLVRFDGYWASESLYRAAELAEQAGRAAQAQSYRGQLQARHSATPWAQRMREKSSQEGPLF